MPIVEALPTNEPPKYIRWLSSAWRLRRWIDKKKKKKKVHG